MEKDLSYSMFSGEGEGSFKMYSFFNLNSNDVKLNTT